MSSFQRRSQLLSSLEIAAADAAGDAAAVAAAAAWGCCPSAAALHLVRAVARAWKLARSAAAGLAGDQSSMQQSIYDRCRNRVCCTLRLTCIAPE